jgi:hypothetical protein
MIQAKSHENFYQVQEVNPEKNYAKIISCLWCHCVVHFN